MNDLIIEIRNELKRNIDEKTRENANHFFKEQIKVYGVKSTIVTKIGNKYFQLVKGFPKAELFDLCEELWKSGFMEEAFIACNWSFQIREKYQPQDIDRFELWIEKFVSNWAECDTLCNHTVGALIEMYPNHLSRLKSWAKSKNRWFRRACSVSLIIPAKRGRFLKEIFEISDSLLNDTDDLVQKGTGWVLKAASQAHQPEVFDYVINNKKGMPRTTLRYAIEKMPKNLKTIAMGK